MNKNMLQHLHIIITSRVTTHHRLLAVHISMFRCNKNISTNQSEQPVTSLLVYHKINNNLPRGQRALLPRSTTAASINRDEGRKIRGPISSQELRLELPWTMVAVALLLIISEFGGWYGFDCLNSNQNVASSNCFFIDKVVEYSNAYEWVKLKRCVWNRKIINIPLPLWIMQEHC